MRLLETLLLPRSGSGRSTRASSCSRRAATTAPTTSTAFSRSRWASSSSSRRTLVVDGGYVQMKTTAGLERVDVIYRRVGDDYLDPEGVSPDSLLGVPGVFQAYLDQKVALANAPGTGVADDKAVYAYVEKMIRFYLSEEPDPDATCRPTCAATRRAPLRARAPRASSWSRRRTARAATACWSARTRPRRSAATSTARITKQSARLHRAADALAVARADHHRGSIRAASRRSAAVRAVRSRDLRAAGRTHARRAEARARWSSTRPRAAAARTPGSCEWR